VLQLSADVTPTTRVVVGLPLSFWADPPSSRWLISQGSDYSVVAGGEYLAGNEDLLVCEG
jgi:hypothetical protein